MTDTPTIIIRQAVLDDAGLIAEFNQNMARETEALELVPEIILSGVKALLSNRNLGFYLLAEADDEVVGSLMVTTEWSDWRNARFWWIQSVYVLPQWRRKGLYRKLYQRVKQLAAENRDVCGYRLYVEKENTIAQTTYDNVGMHETRYKMYEELKSGVTFFQKS